MQDESETLSRRHSSHLQYNSNNTNIVKNRRCIRNDSVSDFWTTTRKTATESGSCWVDLGRLFFLLKASDDLSLADCVIMYHSCRKFHVAWPCIIRRGHARVMRHWTLPLSVMGLNAGWWNDLSNWTMGIVSQIDSLVAWSQGPWHLSKLMDMITDNSRENRHSSH